MHHLILVVAALLLVLGLRGFLQYRASKAWPEVVATVTRVSEKEDEVAMSEYARNSYYYPEIEYEYHSGSNDYLGRTVSFEKENVWIPAVGAFGDNTPQEQRWWLQLKPGDKITAYVNPENPTEAVLVNAVSQPGNSHHLALMVSGALLAIAWLFLHATT